ncbi:DUF551 domain-containing protein [Salmonella enterica]|uniref:DUF551 domain-containing protein n=2 Tax=Salmonella enterica TaxID=28901 RepID=UPI00107C002A|nr:DUF551 domain-containing protein [Salmonella enterica]EDY0674241.1 DUF551 domain-containing protein [Salmonella enterica subsp. enterica serovar Brancaster]EEC0405079.1 DUF551 domain-containing protein [Salmonella enterica subsp. enterica]EHJ0491336.1 DUF551 domain-containing protein [Salmonella enterica subsp. enterica serovar Cubana]EAQ6146185.1 DUF551 domain-containing protein [Salmonella enterica]
MTRFTKEQLLKRLEEQMSSARYALGFVQDSEILRDIEMDLRLAEIARASLTAEPIGAFHISDQQVEGTSDYIKDGEWPIDNGVIEVYTAPPAPEPMKDHQIRELVNDLRDIAVEYHGTQQLRERIARTVRSAMLQAGNSPVTPDGWISCSERMPEETGDIIVVSDGIVMSGISYSRRDGFYIAALEYDDDEPIDGVTHWMPLPEPPLEAK